MQNLNVQRSIHWSGQMPALSPVESTDLQTGSIQTDVTSNTNEKTLGHTDPPNISDENEDMSQNILTRFDLTDTQKTTDGDEGMSQSNVTRFDLTDTQKTTNNAEDRLQGSHPQRQFTNTQPSPEYISFKDPILDH